MPGQEAVRSINGPMSSTLEGVELWTKAVVASEPWSRDPNMIPLPYREVALPSKLCFGLISDNGTVKPTPPVQRALKEVRESLEAAGHTVIDWSPHDAPTAGRIIQQLFVGDGGGKIAAAIAAGNEPWPKGMSKYAEAHQKVVEAGIKPSVEDYWTTQAERTAYAKAALDAWMSTKELSGTRRPFDGVISPVTPWPACPKYVDVTQVVRNVISVLMADTALEAMCPILPSGTFWTSLLQRSQLPL